MTEAKQKHTPGPCKKHPSATMCICGYKRLKAVNAELLAALQGMIETNPHGECWCDNGHAQNQTECYGCIARAAIRAALPEGGLTCSDKK